MQCRQDSVKLCELFAGIGAQAQALRNIGCEVDATVCEIDEAAYRSYCAIHGDTPNLGDITKVEHLPDCDILTWSFPCCPKGTLIRTKDGYQPIEEVTVGTMVRTHMNRFRPVVRTMSRTSPDIYRIKAVGCDLKLTAEHPLYVYRDGIFQWVKVKNLLITDRLTYCINTESKETELSDDVLWLLGRYVADGHVDANKYNSVEFSIGLSKEAEFIEKIPQEYVSRARSVLKKGCKTYRIADADLKKMCLEFGNHSTKKHIPQWVLDLPARQLKSFLDGYLSGDGHVRRDVATTMFSTVSKELFIGLQECILKTNGIVCSQYIRHDSRKKTFNDTYNGQFAYRSDAKKLHQACISDKAVADIRSIEYIEGEVEVYNLEVAEDNSYTADNVVVHNCQAISQAGAKKGLDEGSGTTSSLAWEVIRLLKDAKERGALPRILLMENVKALLYDRNIENFERIQRELEGLGYTNSYEVLNALDFGIPQNRERVFMISSLNGRRYRFPKGERTTRILREMLEENPSEENFLTEKQTERYQRIVEDGIAAGNGYATLDSFAKINVVGSMGWKGFESMNRVYGEDGVAPTIPTGRSRTHIPKIEVVGTTDPEGFEHRCRVHSPDGYCPTVVTGANCVPKIIDGDMECLAYPTNTKKGYMEAESGDGLVMDRVHKARGTVQKAKVPTLNTGNGCGTGVVTDDLRIRFLSPRECWRLMGFTDDAYDKAEASGATRSQLYRQAGNSIVVPVLEAIFKGILDGDYEKAEKQTGLDRFME